jgi:hypothetical protein
VAGLAAAVVELLIGPLRPAAALPEGHLLQYQVRRLAVTRQMSACSSLLKLFRAAGALKSLLTCQGLLVCAAEGHCCHGVAGSMPSRSAVQTMVLCNVLS